MNKFIIIGNPNSGKTLLFNSLTGLNRKVSNFPGVTVELHYGQSNALKNLTLIDFPGIYTLNPITDDEEIAVKNFEKLLIDPELHTILYVLDATRLERSLYLAFQIISKAKSHNKSVAVILNMMDEVQSKNLSVDIASLKSELGVEVLGISARNSNDVSKLNTLLKKLTSIEQNRQYPTKSFSEDVDVLKSQAKLWARKFGPSNELILKSQNRLDKIFLSSWAGGFLFAFIMLLLFQAIFTWASPLMDGIEAAIGWISEHVVALVPEGIIADFLNDAVFGGFGAFLVFVPQIFFLSFIIGFLEDSGYLARAAVICHRPLSYFGLSGKSFVPLLTGHACAIPAIMATRNMESPIRRKLTMLAIPLMSCSARLPVYGLFIAALIPANNVFFGLIGLQGIVFFALFALGIITALLLSALVFQFNKDKKQDTPFVLELPPYRWPHWKNLLTKSIESSWNFVAKAGGIIFSVTVVVWILGYFPNGQEHLDSSWLSYLGRAIEPIIEPLGMDWKFGVAILASFLAREVFVGTLGTMYGIEGADENFSSLATQIQDMGMSLATGLAILTFYVIAPQCASTIAVLKKEMGTWKYPIQILIGLSLLAYAMSWIVYLIAS